MTDSALRLEAANLKTIKGVKHGFFTRLGGVSDGIYRSLNCGVGSQDVQAHVVRNRARVAEQLDASENGLTTIHQFHSNIAVIADNAWPENERPKADAVVTATASIAIGIVTADCTPVLLCDPGARVVGAAHAGWRGAFTGIVEATVAAMISLGASATGISAAIGPTISQRAYEVGEDFRARFIEQDPDSAVFFANDENTGEPHFDLPRYVANRLEQAGIQQIFDIGLCTYYDVQRLYSYRRSQHRGETDYGRQISAIVLT